MGVTVSLVELEACADAPRSIYHSIADFNRYSTPNGAVLASSGVLVDVPEQGQSCAVSSSSGRIRAQIPTGLPVDGLFPGDTVRFSSVKYRGRRFFVRMQLQQKSRSGRFLRSRSLEDFTISYHCYLHCCGVLAQQEQLARWSTKDSPVFRRFFRGKKVSWMGCIRRVSHGDDGDYEVAVQMDVRGGGAEAICLILEKSVKNQGPRLQPGLWIAFTAELLRQGGRFLWHTLRALDAVVLVDPDMAQELDQDTELESSSEDERVEVNSATEADGEAARSDRKRRRSEGAAEEEALCVVCQDSAKTHAFLPCGHFCICANCAEYITRQSPCVCPLCRRAARSTLRIWE